MIVRDGMGAAAIADLLDYIDEMTAENERLQECVEEMEEILVAD